MTQPNDHLSEWRIKEIAREASELAAKKAIEDFCGRIGVENLALTRRNLDFLATLAEAAAGRRSEWRKLIYGLLSGVVLSVLGYLAAAFKGHIP